MIVNRSAILKSLQNRMRDRSVEVNHFTYHAAHQITPLPSPEFALNQVLAASDSGDTQLSY